MIRNNEDERMREEKLIQIRMLTKTINWEVVQTLTGSEADLASAGYRQLKDQLSMLCAVNPYCRFLYLMGQRQDGTIFFFVDSEPPDSKDYSPPGQIYYEASDAVRRVFDSGKETIVGPTTDRWGTWINALAPWTAPHNEKFVTVVVGMDIDIRNWNREIVLRSLVPVVITLMLEVLIIFFFILQWRTERAKQRIADSEARLTVSESKYRSVVENIQDIFYRVDANNIITMASPSAASIFGYDSADELVGRDTAVFWANPDQCSDMRTELNRAGEVREWEIEARRRDGTLLILAATVHLIRDEQGNPAGYEGICRNITDRKQAESALKKSEEKYRLLIENSHDVIYTISADGVFIFVSPAWTALLGHPVDRVVGQPFQQFVHPDDVPACMAFLKSVIETGQRQEGVVYRIRHIDGSWYWHTSSAVPLRDESGTIIGFEGICRDITQRKRAEEALRENRARLHMALEGSKAGLWDWNIKTGETVFNDRWAEIVGCTLKELGPTSIRTWIDLCHPDDLKKSNMLLEKHFSKESDYYDCEARMKHKDGRWVWIHDRGKVVEWDKDGRPVRMIGTHVDITGRKNAETERERLMLELKNAFESIKTLRGLLPICASCKKIRNDKGYWEQIETYIRERSDAEFSHGICPECAKKIYPEFYDENGNRIE